MCVSTVEQLQKIIALEGNKLKPIFGICLGNQLMGLAAGCTASKLPFGNRGQNQVTRFRLLVCPLRWNPFGNYIVGGPVRMCRGVQNCVGDVHNAFIGTCGRFWT